MTTVYNAVLVRYANGHTYVDRSNGAGLRELYIEMGGVQDEDRARSYGAQFLALSRDEITTVADQGQVRATDQIPGLAFGLADHIDGDMVVSVTSSLVGDGDAQVTLELGDARRIRLEALNRQLQRACSGMRSEFSAPARTGQEQGSGTDTTPPMWSQSGAIHTTALSPPWVASRPFHASWLELAAETAGSEPSRVTILRNGVVAGDAWLGAGDKRSVTIINRGWQTGDNMLLWLRVVGDGIEGLSAAVRGTMV
jgi:hypothetical protein